MTDLLCNEKADVKEARLWAIETPTNDAERLILFAQDADVTYPGISDSIIDFFLRGCLPIDRFIAAGIPRYCIEVWREGVIERRALLNETIRKAEVKASGRLTCPKCQGTKIFHGISTRKCYRCRGLGTVPNDIRNI